MVDSPDYDWNFKTAPQPELHDRSIAWPRGKVIGGSSAINFLMSSHASRVDIDNWEALGNPGWNFDALQPYYRKAETYTAPPTDELGTHIINPALHGDSGPVQTSFPQGVGDFDRAWSKTFVTLGLDPKRDPREGATLGGYSLPKYMDSMARRSHAGNAYYAPNAGRPNLTVLTGALVEKIVFEKRKGAGEVVAVGVKYLAAGTEYLVKTRGEVILSAGSVQSPQILELSGIGSPALLSSLGIDIVVENPNVGENLQVGLHPPQPDVESVLIQPSPSQDHNLVGIGYQACEGIPTGEMLSQPGVLDWALNEWSTKGAGPLAGGATGTAFLSHTSLYPEAERESSRAQLLALLSSVPTPTQRGLARQHELQKAQLLNDTEADVQINFGAMGVNPLAHNDISQIFAHGNPGGFAGLMAALTHAFSRGSVHITSADPRAPPRIDPRYLSHPLDLELLSQGLLFTQTLAATPPLASFLVDAEAASADCQGGTPPPPPSKKIQPGFGIAGRARMTSADARRLVRDASGSSWHPIGTCSMLPRGDDDDDDGGGGGVVDARLRVYGVANLRVVDASVLPLHVRGNLVSCVYAVAERAADLIKEDKGGAWKQVA
jgi:choline dehydrogenase